MAVVQDPAATPQMIFGLFERHRTSFENVSFLYEGSIAATAKNPSNPSTVSFQGFYAYRSDGATLLDIFTLGSGDPPIKRTVMALIKGEIRTLNATPDSDPPLRNREPDVRPGGPGVLPQHVSPERIFLSWNFSRLKDPSDHECEIKGWEDVNGSRCLKIRYLEFPRSSLKGAVGDPLYTTTWVDLAHDGYPRRLEMRQGGELVFLTEITDFAQLDLPNGRRLWMPRSGKTWTFTGTSDKGAPIRTKNPSYEETTSVLINTVKFNQSLPDEFFSVKKHALLTSDEGLLKLQREMERIVAAKAKEVVPADPKSRKQRLDAAFEEAERQSKMLEASSAAREGAGWTEFAVWSMGIFGVVLVSLGGLFYWRSR